MCAAPRPITAGLDLDKSSCYFLPVVDPQLLDYFLQDFYRCA